MKVVKIKQSGLVRNHSKKKNSLEEEIPVEI